MLSEKLSISTADLKSYDQNGFLQIPDFVSKARCLELRERALEIISQSSSEEIASVFSTTEQTHTQDEYFINSASQIKCFFEKDALDTNGKLTVERENAINKIGHAQHDIDPIFETFSYTPEISALAKALGYIRPLALQAMYIFKAPGTGGEVIAHTDHPFLWTDPPSVMGLWFAIDTATEENGCLWAMPGGHKTEPIRSRFKRTASNDGKVSTTTEVFDNSPYPPEKFVPLPAERGTLILLNGNLPHKSAHNHSSKPRHAYTLHLIEGDESKATYLEDNWLQRNPNLPLRCLYDVA